MRTSRIGCVCLVFAVLMLAFSVCAQAQTAHFSYAQLTRGGGFLRPANVAVDASGNIFVADAGNNAMKEIPAGCITSSCVVTLGSGFNLPNGVAVDATGNVIVGDTGNNAVKVILAVNGSIPDSPTISTLGGGFKDPAGVAKDGDGNVYVSDFGNSAVKLIPPGCGDSSCVKTLGSGISYPNGIALDANGNVFVTSALSNAVYEILAVNGSIPASPTINTLGSGFSHPNGVAADASGNVYVADSGNNALKEILAVNGSIPTSPTVVTLDSNLYWPTDVVLDASGALYVADYKNDRVVELGIQGVNFGSVVIGQTSAAIPLTFTFDTGGTIGSPVALTMGATGLDFAVDLLIGGGQCVAGSSYSAGDTCTVYATLSPLAPGARRGAVMLYDTSTPPKPLATAYIRGVGVGPAVAFGPGTITTAAGNGTGGYQGDGGAATSAELWQPSGVAVDGAGNLYIGDNSNDIVRKVDAATGIITTVAGTGVHGYSGDGGPAISAEMGGAYGVAVDGAGNLYLSDVDNIRIRKVSAATGVITTVAGNGAEGYSGDGGAATSAKLFYPTGVAVDGAGNLYIADAFNDCIREVSAATGIINTVAGSGTAGYNGDGGAATSAELHGPYGIAVDGAGNLYIADNANSRIRKVSVATGIISTVVGNGTAGFTGDGGTATSAELYDPQGIAVDGAGNLYIGDTVNYVVRKVSAATGIITTLVGNGTGGYSGDGGAPTSAELRYVSGLAVDGAGNLYVADRTNNRIRKVEVSDVPSLTFSSTKTGSVSTSQDVVIENLGNAQLVITTISAAANFSLGGSDTSCAASGQLLNSAASCTLGIEFAPQGSGPILGSVVLTDNALNVSGATQQIALSGTGQSSGTTTSVTVGTNPSGLSFSVDGTTYTTSQTLTWNIGDSHTIATTSPQTSGGTQNTFASWSDGGALSHSVAASASTTNYTATFSAAYQLTTAASPAAGGTVTPASGSYYASGTVVNLSATPNSGYAFSSWTGNVASTSSASTTITMSAPQTVTANFSTTSPTVTLTPAVLSFGSQTDGTTSTAQNVVLKNSGTAQLFVTAIAVTGTNAANFVESDNCVSTSPLAANATCTIAVKFAPTMPGSDTASVSITDNATGSPQGVTLSGTGTAPLAPSALLTPASLSFSTTSGTSSASQPATLSNTGNAALTIGSITIGGTNPSAFSETSNCGTTLAAGSSCSISVTFNPASVASFIATLAVADNAAGTPQTTTLSGTGTAPDYGVNSSTPSQTVTAGGATTYNIGVQSIGAYNGSVTLSVTGLPTGATATFSPNPVTLGSISSDVSRRAAVSNTGGTSILTVQTSSGAKLAQSRARWPFIAPIFGFLMLLPARRLHRQYLFRFLIIFTILGIGVALVGCGGGFVIAPQSKTYTLTITGTSGTVSHSTTVLLTVK